MMLWSLGVEEDPSGGVALCAWMLGVVPHWLNELLQRQSLGRCSSQEAWNFRMEDQLIKQWR